MRAIKALCTNAYRPLQTTTCHHHFAIKTTTCANSNKPFVSSIYSKGAPFVLHCMRTRWDNLDSHNCAIVSFQVKFCVAFVVTKAPC